MISLTMDGLSVQVEPGTTLLEVARTLGIRIPTLCHLAGLPPQTTCMVCVVKVAGVKRLLPACSTRAEAGMVVTSESDEVRADRRRAVELLLGDHTGDCVALCESACPAHWSVPRFLRLLADGRPVEALALSTHSLILPRTLSHVCPAPCEGACRRKPAGGAVSIRRLHGGGGVTRPVAIPEATPLGRTVAVIGGGAAGMAAAAQLALDGVACELLEQTEALGGGLKGEVASGRIPAESWEADLAILTRLGVKVRVGQGIADRAALTELHRRVDAVIVAVGAGADWHAVPLEGVFCVASTATRRPMAVRAIAAGRAAAGEALAFLCGEAWRPPRAPLTTRYGKLDAAGLEALLQRAARDPRVADDAALLGEELARTEAGRCLHCDCRKAETCRLRQVAKDLDARPLAFAGGHAAVSFDSSHPEVIFEPGKCIKCGICVALTGRSPHATGLGFVNRGFGVVVESPFGKSLAEALGDQAARCVECCPTGALAWRTGR